MDRTSGLSAYGSAQTWRRMFVIFIYFFVCRLIAFFSFFQSGVYVTFSKLRRVFYMIRKKVVWNQLFSLWWMEDTGLVQKIPWVPWACSVSCFSPINHQKNHLLAMTKIINLNIKNLLFEAVTLKPIIQGSFKVASHVGILLWGGLITTQLAAEMWSQ